MWKGIAENKAGKDGGNNIIDSFEHQAKQFDLNSLGFREPIIVYKHGGNTTSVSRVSCEMLMKYWRKSAL